jgi:plastocyanin
MTLRELPRFLLISCVIWGGIACPQDRHANGSLTLHLVAEQAGHQRTVPAVIWLETQAGTPALPFVPHDHYTLLQKNRTFIPHLQVIPIGSTVQFPNKDPFFHNVFSLFDGKRFDLGLYEAGSSKSVVFSREGPSYIFCNIHPEMSAVILALSTPLYAIASDRDSLQIRNIPAGSYKLHYWIEGVQQQTLDSMERNIEIASQTDLGDVRITVPAVVEHENMFGKPYEKAPDSPY